MDRNVSDVSWKSVLSYQVLEEKGRYPPRDSTLAPDGHHPSAVPGAVKYIRSFASRCGCTLGGFWVSNVRVLTLTSRIVLIPHRLVL